MYYINEKYENTIVINKSKFISYAYRVNNIDEIDDILKEMHKKYYDSTHICYAYVLDNGNIKKAFDDKEPSKTAGYPILDVIEKKEISNILILVIRYFGGILLGANGLVRAYSSSASEVLNNAIYYKKKKVLEFDLTISYKEYDIITKIKEITILDSLFLTDVFLHLAIDYEYYDKLKSILISNKILSIPSNEKITYKEIKAL